MTASRLRSLSLLLVLAVVGGRAVVVLADDRPNQPFAQRATWKPSSTADVRQQVFSWLETSGADMNGRASAEALWQTATMEDDGDYLLDLTCATFALIEPQAKELVDFCSQPRKSAPLPDVTWLSAPATPELLRNNLRLYFGRWLVQELLYDEAAEQLTTLKTGDVVDPAALLFYQAVVYHRTLARDEGLSAIGRLLEREDEIRADMPRCAD